MEHDVQELTTTRFCRLEGCPNELDSTDPERGRYANVCGPCRRGETFQGKAMKERASALGLEARQRPIGGQGGIAGQGGFSGGTPVVSDWRVWFEGELHVTLDGDDDKPTTNEIGQAVQDAIGHTGAVVTDVLDFRLEP